MADLPVPRFYTETRLNLDSATTHIPLPTQSAATAVSKTQPRRTIEDEDEFARRYLATEASVYFRRKQKYPRSFLWRVLDERRVLELQSVDLVQDRHNKGEAVQTLALSFPHPIQPFGIALADPEQRDVLNVFVLTIANELYTLTIHKELFVRPASTQSDVGNWCKICVPSSFSFRSPYRLVATSAHELLISLHDGGLLRLTRKSGDDGSVWRETFFTEGGWGSSLRGLIPWKGHNTVRFGNSDLESTTAASIAPSPDGKHIFTVCLNHTLRAWNLNTGKIGVHRDLLGENERDPQKLAQYLIGPTQQQLMQVIDVRGQDGDLYYVVTYSPKQHQFKFWGIRDADNARNGIWDVQDAVQFVPPVEEMMNTTVWKLEEFHVEATPGWRGTQLWIRARSGPNCQVYSLKFDLFDSEDELQRTWKNDWVSVDPGALTVDALRSNPGYPDNLDVHSGATHNTSVTEAWLDFLFYPGRFSLPTLETSLYVFRRGLGQTTSPQKDFNTASKTPLKERICSAIASKVPIERRHSGDLDYDRYEADIAAQWQVFYGLVRDLHKRRSEALSLVVDPEEGMPWLLLSDYISAIRECSEVERLVHNRELLASPEVPNVVMAALQNDVSLDVARLLRAASVFHRTFAGPFEESLKEAVKAEILQEPSHSVPARMQFFDERCGLCAQVSDDDFSRLTDALEELGGYQALDDQLFYDALERLTEAQRGHQERHDLTKFGAKILIRGAQDALQLGSAALLDLLVLVVFLALEVEPSELSPDLDASTLFVRVLSELKEYAVLDWLASTVRSERVGHKSSHAASSTKTLTLDKPQPQLNAPSAGITLLESIFLREWADMLSPGGPQISLITYWCRAWTFGSLVQQYDVITSHIMGDLLKHGNIDLAFGFLPFLPSTPWGTYLKARLYLASGDHTLAAIYFKKTAFPLALGHFDVDQSDTAELLDLEEREYFSEGLARYYQHILNIFDKLKLHAFVMEFAKLALQSLAASDAQHPSARTDILTRLFTASILTHSFQDAYTALTLHTNPILRKSSLTTLITAMATHNHIPQLLRFPFATLANDVDAVLASLAHKTLNISTGPAYHKILYAWRVSRGDFRGAAAALWERVQRLKTSVAMHEPDDETVAQAYLLLINTLACVEESQAWILVEEQRRDSGGSGGGGVRGKEKGRGKSAKEETVERTVVTLEDVRREYGAELDRVAAMETGRFAFGGEAVDVL